MGNKLLNVIPLRVSCEYKYSNLSAPSNVVELRETKQYVIFNVGSTRYQYLLRTANDANVILNVIVCNHTIYFRTKKLLIIIEETLDKCDGEYEIYFAMIMIRVWRKELI